MRSPRISFALFALLCALLTPAIAAQAGTVDATWQFTRTDGTPLTNKTVTLQPIRSYYVAGQVILTGDPITGKTDATGTYTRTNLSNIPAYIVSVTGYQETLVTNYFGTNTTGAVNAADYTAISTNLGNGVYGITMAAADLRYTTPAQVTNIAQSVSSSGGLTNNAPSVSFGTINTTNLVLTVPASDAQTIYGAVDGMHMNVDGGGTIYLDNDTSISTAGVITAGSLNGNGMGITGITSNGIVSINPSQIYPAISVTGITSNQLVSVNQSQIQPALNFLSNGGGTLDGSWRFNSALLLGAFDGGFGELDFNSNYGFNAYQLKGGDSSLTLNTNFQLLGGQFIGNGSGLTNLDAGQLLTGTVPMGRLTSGATNSTAGLINGAYFTDGTNRWTSRDGQIFTNLNITTQLAAATNFVNANAGTAFITNGVRLTPQSSLPTYALVGASNTVWLRSDNSIPPKFTPGYLDVSSNWNSAVITGNGGGLTNLNFQSYSTSNRPTGAADGTIITITNLVTPQLFVFSKNEWKPVGEHLTLFATNLDISSANSTGEQFYFTNTIPAGLLTSNAIVNISWSGNFSSGSNSKIVRVYFGTNIVHYVDEGTPSRTWDTKSTSIRNRNSLVAQVCSTAADANTTSSGSIATGAINTANSVDLKMSVQKATGTDAATLSTVIVDIFYP